MTTPLPQAIPRVGALATKANLLTARKVQLIGLYGDPEVRRALLMLPTGQPLRVEQGDETEAGEVIEIGEDYIVLRQGARETTLSLPGVMLPGGGPLPAVASSGGARRRITRHPVKPAACHDLTAPAICPTGGP